MLIFCARISPTDVTLETSMFKWFHVPVPLLLSKERTCHCFISYSNIVNTCGKNGLLKVSSKVRVGKGLPNWSFFILRFFKILMIKLVTSLEVQKLLPKTNLLLIAFQILVHIFQLFSLGTKRW